MRCEAEKRPLTHWLCPKGILFRPDKLATRRDFKRAFDSVVHVDEETICFAKVELAQGSPHLELARTATASVIPTMQHWSAISDLSRDRKLFAFLFFAGAIAPEAACYFKILEQTVEVGRRHMLPRRSAIFAISYNTEKSPAVLLNLKELQQIRRACR